MIDGLTLGAALLLGFAASGHCVLMCGGISAALGMATVQNGRGRPRAALLASYQLGRIVSYVLAGLLIGGLLGGVVHWLEGDALRRGLRALSALALLLAAFVVWGGRDPSLQPGRRLWTKIAPLGRKLLPVTSTPRALAFGMVWGWMPCGFVYTVLMIAALQFDALRAAATMAAFGLGTAPAMFATALGAHRVGALAARPAGRHLAGALLLASAALTLTGPWLGGLAPWLHRWLPFYCVV